MIHRPEDLVTLFNTLFRNSYRTELVRGDHEPEYLPAPSADGYAQVIFAHGYFASALHEVSHWCIAGERRRTLPDYGYWYCPDGRSADQQRIFEQVEVKPQALEWLFSVACGSPFHISVDNLEGGGAIDEHGFKRRTFEQACDYLEAGMPGRAQRFFDALQRFYNTGDRQLDQWRADHMQLLAPELSQARHYPRETRAYDATT